MSQLDRIRIVGMKFPKSENPDAIFDRVKKQLKDGSYDLSNPSHKLIFDVFVKGEK